MQAKWGFLLLLLLLLTACRFSPVIHRAVNVTQGRAAEIRFADPWIEHTSGNEATLLPGQDDYEIRRRTDVPTHQLLLGGKSGVPYGIEYPGKQPGDVLYSENIYSLDLDRNYEVGIATREDWERAVRVSEEARPLGIPYVTPVLDYNGMSIQIPAEHVGLVSTSTGGNWLAVFSYSGKETPGLMPFLGGGVKRRDVYWDVYDVKSRSKVMSWHASSIQSPALGFNAAWVEERYLVMQLRSGPNSFVIADLMNQN
jgi:hypothetical protein